MGLDDLKLEDFFELDTSATRGHSKKLKKQSFELDVRKYFFSNRIFELWNKLSEDTVSSKSLDAFKKLLDRDMSDLGYW